MFLKNAWYVACKPEDIESRPLGRMVCGEDMVFFRGADGKAAALEDYCPHRGAALSLGFMRKDGNLACGYHGMVVGSDGKCISMVGQRVGGMPSVRSFPVAEHYGFIWVWPGDAELADTDKLPKLHWGDNPDWVYGGGLYHINCDYRLMIDNLMDLTHETYVHAATIGQSEIEEAPPVTKVEDGQVVTSRFMHDIEPPAFWAATLRGYGVADDLLCDRWQICRFSLPSNVMIDVGVAHAGQGVQHAPAGRKASSTVVNFITPETETSHWYFWGMARDFRIDDEALTDMIRDGQARIFKEDLDVLEGQQRNLSRRPERRLVNMNIDSGGVRSRELIERMLAQEAS